MKFCWQCMTKFLGENLANENPFHHNEEELQPVHCDGCGNIEVDHMGFCMTHSDHKWVQEVSKTA